MSAAVVGLHHAGVYVESLERSIAFYSEVFGLELAERFTFDAEKIAFLTAGAGRLELIEAIESAASEPRRRTGVVDHVALEVRELDQLLAQVRERGVTLLDSSPIAVAAIGARIAFCAGPDGERIELFEILST